MRNQSVSQSRPALHVHVVNTHHLIYGVCIQHNHLSSRPREIVYLLYLSHCHSLRSRICTFTMHLAGRCSDHSFHCALTLFFSTLHSRSRSVALHSFHLRYKQVDGRRWDGKWSVCAQRLLCANDYEHSMSCFFSILVSTLGSWLIFKWNVLDGRSSIFSLNASSLRSDFNVCLRNSSRTNSPDAASGIIL